MSIFITCDSSFPVEETLTKITQAKSRYDNILRYFWISDVTPATEAMKATDARYGFEGRCGFLIEWNKEEGSEFIPEIPQIMYEVFGRDKILVFDLNLEVIPPRN